MMGNDPNRSNYGTPQAPGQPYGAGPGGSLPNTLSGGVRVGAIPREGFLTASFVWMFIGLLVSAGATWFVMNDPTIQRRVMDAWIVLIIGELGLVLGLSFLITRLNAMVALGLFFAYALLNGLTIGVIVELYAQAGGMAGVVSAFLGASAIFGGAAVYGAATKRDLTSLGGILFMGLIGLIVVSFAQMFLFPNSGIANLLIGVVGVVIFTGLTAFDVQRIRNGRVAGINQDSASVMGALALYLDFINLFLMMLRIFGSSRD